MTEASDLGSEAERLMSVFLHAAERFAAGYPDELVAMLSAKPDTARKFASMAPTRTGPRKRRTEAEEHRLVLEVVREMAYPSQHEDWKNPAHESRRKVAQNIVAERYPNLLARGHTTARGSSHGTVGDHAAVLDRVVTKFTKQGLVLPPEAVGSSQWREDGKKRWRLIAEGEMSS